MGPTITCADASPRLIAPLDGASRLLSDPRWASNRRTRHHRRSSHRIGVVQVIVIKPPLCFSEDDCRALVAALSAELLAIGQLDLSKVTHTPT